MTRCSGTGLLGGYDGKIQNVCRRCAGTGKANPFGAVRCVALMLDHFGYSAAGERVERAVAAAIARGRTTVDMGGSFSTAQVGEWLAEHVSQGAVDEN